MRGPAANLPGNPVPGTADYLSGNLSAAALLGMSPANQTRSAGSALPPVDTVAGDMAFVPWHPDSPTFWLVAIAAATVLGIAGASVHVRAFRGRASAELGNT